MKTKLMIFKLLSITLLSALPALADSIETEKDTNVDSSVQGTSSHTYLDVDLSEWVEMLNWPLLCGLYEDECWMTPEAFAATITALTITATYLGLTYLTAHLRYQTELAANQEALIMESLQRVLPLYLARH